MKNIYIVQRKERLCDYDEIDLMVVSTTDEKKARELVAQITDQTLWLDKEKISCFYIGPDGREEGSSEMVAFS